MTADQVFPTWGELFVPAGTASLIVTAAQPRTFRFPRR